MSKAKSPAGRNGTHGIYHLMILDSSSSMSSVRDVTISGFNENLKSLKADKQDDGIEQNASLVTFSDQVECKLWRKSITDVAEIDEKTYRPGGMTALFDAIGKSVARLQDEIKDKIASQDANVIVTVFTDGQENASHEWKSDGKLFNLLEELRASRMWTFTFIGCSEETLKAAKGLGFAAANTMLYDATQEGTQQAFTKLSNSRGGYVTKVRTAVAFKGVDNDAYTSSQTLAQQDFFTDPAVDPNPLNDNK
jgi:Mg-chelatase subunit ChlD